MKPPLKKKYGNDFQTPPAALEPLYPYLKKHWLIWESACGKGNLVNALADHGYTVRATDIVGGVDFLTIPIPDEVSTFATGAKRTFSELNDDVKNGCEPVGDTLLTILGRSVGK